VYGQPPDAIAFSDKRLTDDEAEKLARLIVRLPELVELEKDRNCSGSNFSVVWHGAENKDRSREERFVEAGAGAIEMGAKEDIASHTEGGVGQHIL
jgi:hypothetical protein